MDFIYPREAVERACAVCGEKKTVSRVLGVCLNCIRGRPKDSLSHIREAHGRVRAQHRLLAESPRSPDGVECILCSKNCSIGVTLDIIIEKSDFITLNTTLTEETRGMIGEKELKIIKPTSYIINAARSELID